jgi:hypothetical protein
MLITHDTLAIFKYLAEPWHDALFVSIYEQKRSSMFLKVVLHLSLHKKKISITSASEGSVFLDDDLLFSPLTVD